ncbi:MAG TPA: hypothetical protein PKN33_03250 [Phycisphaerae bacterium]|nr:hypothetical protein [Phycisphaerae bacterium]
MATVLVILGMPEYSENEFQFVDSIESSFAATFWNARRDEMSRLPNDQFIDSTPVARLDEFTFVPKRSWILSIVADTLLTCSIQGSRFLLTRSQQA